MCASLRSEIIPFLPLSVMPRGVSLSPNDDPMIFFSWNSYFETEIEDCFAEICQATKRFFPEI